MGPQVAWSTHTTDQLTFELAVSPIVFPAAAAFTVAVFSQMPGLGALRPRPGRNRSRTLCPGFVAQSANLINRARGAPNGIGGEDLAVDAFGEGKAESVRKRQFFSAFRASRCPLRARDPNGFDGWLVAQQQVTDQVQTLEFVSYARSQLVTGQQNKSPGGLQEHQRGALDQSQALSRLSRNNNPTSR